MIGLPQWMALSQRVFAGAAGSTNECATIGYNGQTAGIFAQTAVSYTTLTGPQDTTVPVVVTVNGVSWGVRMNGGGAAAIPGIVSYALGLASQAGWIYTA